MEISRSEYSSLKSQLEIGQNFHQTELETLSQTYQADLIVYRSENIALLKHINLLRDQIKNLSLTSRIEKDNYEKNEAKLRADLKNAKEISNDKIQLLLKDQKKLRKELGEIYEKYQMKDNKRKKVYLEKIKSLETAVDEKTKIIQEKTNNLQIQQGRYNNLSLQISKSHSKEIKQLKTEIENLKKIHENKENLIGKEREVYNVAIKKIQAGIEALQQSAISENHEISLELENERKRLNLLQKDREILILQRNNALSSLSRLKILSFSEHQDILMLIEHLRSQEIQRNKLQQ